MSVSSLGVEVKTADSPPDEWTSLAANAPLFATPRWLRAVRDRSAGTPHYFLEGPAGLFGMVCSTAETDDGFNLFDIVAGAPRTLPLTDESIEARAKIRQEAPPTTNWFPNLVVSLPSAECVLVGDESKALALAAGIVDWAREQSLAAVTVPYLRRRDTALNAALDDLGFTRSAGTFTSELQLPGSNFDDYLASFTKHRRQSIRHEMRVVAEAGVEIRKRTLSECIDQLVELRLSLKRKYGRTPNEPKERKTFEDLMSNFSDDELHVLTAEAGTATIGFGLDLIYNDVWHGIVSGTDYDDPRSNFVSFELDFYSPIRRAYEIGIKEFQLGLASWEAKHHRGAALVPMDVWTLPLNPALKDAVETSAAVTRLKWSG